MAIRVAAAVTGAAVTGAAVTAVTGAAVTGAAVTAVTAAAVAVAVVAAVAAVGVTVGPPHLRHHLAIPLFWISTETEWNSFHLPIPTLISTTKVTDLPRRRVGSALTMRFSFMMTMGTAASTGFLRFSAVRWKMASQRWGHSTPMEMVRSMRTMRTSGV